MPAQLVALTEGASILLDKPILLLGRHPECDIQIDSRKISRRHCCIAQVADYLVVRDLGSTNGVRINGVRVLEGRLKPGDELTIGNYRYQMRWDSDLVPGPARPRQAKAGPAAGRFDDAALEACDEPVPLAERGGAAKPVATPARPPEVAPPPPPGRRDSHVLPEQLDLAPASDVFPGHPSQAPPAV